MAQRLSREAKALVGKSGGADSSVWLPLWIHLRDTAEIMAHLVRERLSAAAWEAFGLELEELERVARFLGAAHDLGKATILFQHNITQRLPEAKGRLMRAGVIFPDRPFQNAAKSPHALAGEAIALELGCPRGLASIIGAHHGRPQDFTDVHNQLGKQGSWKGNYWAKGQERVWRGIWGELWALALAEGKFASAEEFPELTVPAQLLLAGLLTMADWIASNDHYFPLISVEELGDEECCSERVGWARERLRLPWPWESLCPSMDAEGFKERFGFEPNALQQAVLRTIDEAEEPGLLIVEAQMGVGKTEAALAAVEVFAARFQCGGLFFGLPTQATANGIFGRLRAWAERQSADERHAIRLAHGSAEMKEDYVALQEGAAHTEEDAPEAGLEVHPWFQGRKVALLADFVVGTVDQLLMAALKQKHVMLRQLGLVGKVVVVDECHAYDAYMSRYLDRALEWLGRWRVPVVLLSATLPAGKRAELVRAYLGGSAPVGDWQTCRAYPLLTWASEGEVHQMVVPETAAPCTVRLERGVVGELSVRLREALREGGCAGVIVNTVRRAQALAETLRVALPDCDVILFHSQFVLADRMTLEQEILRRVGKASTPKDRDRLIVVGTQVLEQSLDIDFDFLATELCPMDLLLQRVGRLHRHPRERPEPLREAACLVLDTGEEAFDPGSVAVYGEWLLWRTRRLLPDAFSLPTDLPRLVHDTYGWEQNDPLFAERNEAAYEAYRNLRYRQQDSAGNFVIQGPDDSLDDTLDDFLADTAVRSDAAARAAVRDGDPSIDVLVMVRHADGTIHFLPEGGRAVPTDVPPSQEECRAILRQSLRLPAVFSKRWAIDAVIHELEERTVALSPTRCLRRTPPCFACSWPSSSPSSRGWTLRGARLRLSAPRTPSPAGAKSGRWVVSPKSRFATTSPAGTTASGSSTTTTLSSRSQTKPGSA